MQLYTLEVTFDGDVDMQKAIDKALADAGKGKESVKGIRVTGNATAITGKDWMALKSCFEDGSDWENLTDLDLSGMGELGTISGQEANTTYGKLKTPELPDTIGTIGNYAFYNCENLALTWLPEGVTAIGDYTFAGCEKLELLAGLHEGVKSIGKGAFSGCANLKFTALPDSVEFIHEYAFAGCEKLVLTRLPNLLVIENNTFKGCIGLESLAFPPSGLKFIGDNAFSGCTRLKELAFYTADPPKLDEADVFTGVAEIGTVYCPNGKAGDYRTALEAAGLPGGWRYEPFYTLEVVFDGGDGSGAAMQAAIDAALADVGESKIGVSGIKVTGDATEITGGDWTVLKSCFKKGGWETLTGLDLSGMDNLKTISGENQNGPYDRMESLKLPDGLKTIGDYAFARCYNLALTELPEGVTAIEGSAFYDCYKLDLKELPDTLTSIDREAFSYCEKLALTRLPDGVTSIGESAFLGCTGLTEMTFPSGLNNLKDKAFSGCINLKNLTFKGGNAPVLGTDVFKNVSPTGTLYYPEGAEGYLKDTFGGDDLKDWTFTSVSPYKPGTLNDPDSGVTVKGNFTVDAVLRVGELQLHPEGCPACDKIREWQKTHEVAATYDISLASGSYRGDVEVSIPVDEKYNGQELTIHHCNNHTLETRTLTVQNGMATGTFGGLSPFGVFGRELDHPTPVDHGPIDPPDPNTPIDLTKDQVFTFNGDYANIARVLLDGKEMEQINKTATSADLTWADYTGNAGNIKSGSVIVTLYKEFLKTLPDGKHTLVVEFNDGGTVSAGSAQFTIEKSTATNPKTGDSENMALWIVLVCAAGAAITGVWLTGRRRRRS